MFFTPDYQEVINVANETSLTVVAETDKRSEGEKYLASKRLLESCFISKDADQELFRIICEVSEAK